MGSEPAAGSGGGGGGILPGWQGWLRPAGGAWRPVAGAVGGTESECWAALIAAGTPFPHVEMACLPAGRAPRDGRRQ